MNKKGFEMSFSIIFSIIVIAVIIAVAFYTISYFLRLKQCTELGLYGRELQDEIDRAWNSDSSSAVFTRTLPGFVDKVCIGSLTETSNVREQFSLQRFRSSGGNLFFYPIPSCDIKYLALEHAEFPKFGCSEIKSGKVSLKLAKEATDNLVSVCLPEDSC